MVPGRVKTSLLDAVMPDWAAAAEEPERRQLLEVDPAYVHFRHELARHAVRSSLPIAARRRLHADMLDVLLAAHADPADIVHHAEAAGNQEVVAEYVLVAARGAAALESRQRGVLPLSPGGCIRRSPTTRRASRDARGTGEQPHISSTSSTRHFTTSSGRSTCIEIWDMTKRSGAVYVCSRVSTGSPATADPREATALESIAILEALGESVELARA